MGPKTPKPHEFKKDCFILSFLFIVLFLLTDFCIEEGYAWTYLHLFSRFNYFALRWKVECTFALIQGYLQSHQAAPKFSFCYFKNFDPA